MMLFLESQQSKEKIRQLLKRVQNVVLRWKEHEYEYADGKELKIEGLKNIRKEIIVTFVTWGIVGNDI